VKKTIIAQLSITPIGEGTSVSKYVKIALNAIKEEGVHCTVGAMATTLEVKSLDELFKVVKKAHDAVINAGAKRVVIDLKIDNRLNKTASIESKLKAIER
jgi:uncharacterized protein (TIGR00106 family)